MNSAATRAVPDYEAIRPGGAAEIPAGSRILYITVSYPPIAGSGTWRGFGFTRHLARAGHDVTVICSDRAMSHQNFDPGLTARLPAGIRVHRIPSVFLLDIDAALQRRVDKTGNRLLRRVLSAIQWRLPIWVPDGHIHWGLKAAAKAWRIAGRARFDFVISSGPAHICHLAGRIASRRSGAVWIMDYRDLWTDDPAHCRQTGYQARVFRRLERSFLREADAVVTVSPSWKRHLQARLGAGQEHKVRLIRNGHNLDEPVTAAPRSGAQRAHVHYNGSIAPNHRNDALFEAIERLKRDPEYGPRLPLFTFTGLAPVFQEELRRRGLEEDVLDVGFKPVRESLEYSLGCDALLVMVNANDPTHNAGIIPGKAYDLMTLGRHILAVLPPESDVRELLESYPSATLCDVRDPEEICRGLKRVMDLQQKGILNATADAVREEAFRRYSRETQTRELITLLSSLCAARAAA